MKKNRWFSRVWVFLGMLSLLMGSGYANQATHIFVDKSDRVMILYQGDQVLKKYQISLGGQPQGHKRQEGDSRTPEGTYTIDYRNPKSRYHLSLHISYPNQADKADAKARGVSPGGDIMIHGLPNGYGDLNSVFAGRDWTDGCIAVSNAEIEEIWSLVPNGTKITIQP